MWSSGSYQGCDYLPFWSRRLLPGGQMALLCGRIIPAPGQGTTECWICQSELVGLVIRQIKTTLGKSWQKKPESIAWSQSWLRREERKPRTNMVSQRVSFTDIEFPLGTWRYSYLNLCITQLFSVIILLYSTFLKILMTSSTLEKVLHLSVWLVLHFWCIQDCTSRPAHLFI